MHKPSHSNPAQWVLFSFIIILLSGCLENVSFTEPCSGACAAISNYGMSLPIRDKDPGEISDNLHFVKNKGYVLNGDFLARWTRLDNQQNVIIIDDGFGERLLQESISIGSAQYDYFYYNYPDNTLIPSGTTHITVYLRAPDGTETVEASIPLSVIGKAPQENVANSTTKKVTYAAKQLGGSAEEIRQRTELHPEQMGAVSDSSLIPIHFNQRKNGSWVWEGNLAVDGKDAFVLALLNRNEEQWSPELTSPQGVRLRLRDYHSNTPTDNNPLDINGIYHQRKPSGLGNNHHSDVYTVSRYGKGRWKARIVANTLPNNQPPSDGFIIVTNPTPYQLYSYVDSQQRLTNRPLGLLTYLFQDEKIYQQQQQQQQQQQSSELSTAPKPNEKPTTADGQQAEQQELNDKTNSVSIADEDKTGAAETVDASLIKATPEQQNSPRLPLLNSIDSATATLTRPDGSTEQITLFDDGLHRDQQAGDGLFGMEYVPTQAGVYQYTLMVQGNTPEGEAYQRTAESSFTVVNLHLQANQQTVTAQPLSTTRVITATQDPQRLSIPIELQLNSGILPSEVWGYAEVWGKNNLGEAIPVAWTGGILTPTQQGQQVTLPLTFHADWLAYEQALPPFELKKLEVLELNTYIQLLKVESLPLSLGLATQHSQQRRSSGKATTISQAMREGLDPNRNRYQQRAAGPAKFSPEWYRRNPVVTVHGYCSAANPWTSLRIEDDFRVRDAAGAFIPNSTYAVELGELNISNHEFAKRIKDDLEAQNFDSFSIVAHSQGGLAALDLLTYWHTGLDKTHASRPIQTLGSPFMGAVSNNWASFGKFFGLNRCRSNVSLSPSDAATWLKTIPWQNRKKVSYFLGSEMKSSWYEPYTWNDTCSTLSYFISGYDDGVIGTSEGRLPGGKSMGITRKQCHNQAGMQYMALYQDRGRNRSMTLHGRQSNDIGVIPDNMNNCPIEQRVTIYMDDEDSRNRNSRWGWLGEIRSTGNTLFQFCKVSGTAFRPLSTAFNLNNHYAVLQLGSECPAGSVPFSRKFDNEDRRNKNRRSGLLWPNQSTHDTLLKFCLFRQGTHARPTMPDLGFSYGVFAAAGFRASIANGAIYIDDEDSRNRNGFWVYPGASSHAQRIVRVGRNTRIGIAKVR